MVVRTKQSCGLSHDCKDMKGNCEVVYRSTYKALTNAKLASPAEKEACDAFNSRELAL